MDSTVRYGAGILTVSTKGARGERDDESGRVATEMATAAGFDVSERMVVTDDQGQIAQILRHWCDTKGLALILTTGGTGLSPRDVTPDATVDVIERAVPGIAEALRTLTLHKTPTAMLPRAVAGTRGPPPPRTPPRAPKRA